MEAKSPALAGGFLTTEPPGKSFMELLITPLSVFTQSSCFLFDFKLCLFFLRKEWQKTKGEVNSSKKNYCCIKIGIPWVVCVTNQSSEGQQRGNCSCSQGKAFYLEDS